jgi:FixJ family two-component response regulator
VADPDSIVYVVDDDASVRAGLESLLRSAGWAVRCFASGFEFLARPACNTLACLVLDVHLAEGNGLELQRELASREPLPIVFITGYGDISMSVRAIKAGAVEFLPKPFRDQELLEAVEQALSRARTDWHARVQLSKLQSRFESLTPRERQVLNHVVAGRLNKQIASVLGISEVTVKEHRGHLMQKLRASSIAELVRMAVRVGIEPEAPHANPTKVWCSPPTDDTSVLRGARTRAEKRR